MSLFMEGSETLGTAIFGHAELGDRRRDEEGQRAGDQKRERAQEGTGETRQGFHKRRDDGERNR